MRVFRHVRRIAAVAALVLSAGLFSPAALAVKCDVDNDGDIDRNDLNLIQQAILTRAPVSGPDDPRDADNNGAINSLDARVCALRCTRTSCAVEQAAAPTITGTVTPPPNGAGWNRTDVRVSFTCANATSCPAPIDVTTEGANQTVAGTATGPGGSATASVTLNIDKTPPRIAIASPSSGAGFFVPNVAVTGSVADDLSGVASATCGSAVATITGGSFSCDVALVPGANALAPTATDVAGNTASASPVNVSYTRIPNIRITAPANLSYLNISPTTVSGTVDDPTATVTVNSIPAVVSNGAFSLALPIAEGPNIIAATASTPTGAAGTASIEVTLDTTPPRVTITSPPDQFETTDAAITVSGIVNDIVVGTVNDQQAQVKVNGADAQVANRMFVASGVPLAVGPNVIQAVGRDRVGNAATTQVTVVRKAVTSQAQIRLLSGNNQAAAINSPVAAPLLIRLTDANGAPAPNKPVIFKVTQNDGLVTAGAAPAPTVIATTNAQGQAQAQWTLGGRAGAGGNTVEAYSVGFDGTAIFTATGTLGTPARIVVDTGNNQIGAIGQPLPRPFLAVVVDAGNNRLGGVPVTFTVGQGGGSFSGQQTYTTVTDSDGRAAATLTLGMQEGEANNLVSATFPSNPGFPAAFTASGRAPGDPARTTISGVVLDNSNLPIPGVTVRALLTNIAHSNANAMQTAQSAQTDAQGQFAIQQAPVGFVKLFVDGSTAQRPGVYPSLEYDMVTVAGQFNTVGQPIFLLALNTANQLCVSDTTGGGTLTIPEAPGFSLTFGPGQVTFPGGSKSGCISVSVVHADKVPMAPGFGQQPRFIVTIQPSGALFNPPAAITLPNVDGLKPRAVTEMYSFDHDISSFVAIGTGTVSDDGLVIRSNRGVGVLKAGWHCGGDPNAIGTVADCPACFSCQGPPIGRPGGSCEPDARFQFPGQAAYCLTNPACCGFDSVLGSPGGLTCARMSELLEAQLFIGGCNAFRHAFWMCCTSRNRGEQCAVDLGRAHESDSIRFPPCGTVPTGQVCWQGCDDTNADLANNATGAQLGQTVLDHSLCIDVVLQALGTGSLVQRDSCTRR